MSLAPRISIEAERSLHRSWLTRGEPSGEFGGSPGTVLVFFALAYFSKVRREQNMFQSTQAAQAQSGSFELPGVSIVLCYTFQLTVFLPVLALNARRSLGCV